MWLFDFGRDMISIQTSFLYKWLE